MSLLQRGNKPAASLVRSRLQSTTRPSQCRQYTPSRALLTGWRGTRTEDHATDRVSKKDTTDPVTENVKAGQEQREEGNGKKDKSKSQATTERDPTQSKKKSEEDMPEAPRPVIGMTDERGKKGQ